MNASAVHDLDPVGRIGRYEILGRIAMGGMAEIFLARESGPRAASREIVVKRVLPHIAADPKLIEMFVQEAQLSMRLRHPNICPIYEFGEDDGDFYLAMEWVHGVSLARLVEAAKLRGGMPVAMVVKLIADVAGALHHAHTAHDAEGRWLKIVHRDVTPENIMVSFDGVARLLDFGIAKTRRQLDKTEAGVLKGKFAYMSPEQYQGEPLDARSDVFSLGVCLYEALTSQSLFARASEYETVAAIILETSTPSVLDARPELPPFLDTIVQTALAKQRENRYPTADDMQAGLTRFLSDGRHAVRHVDVARYLADIFPRERAQGPKLERVRLSARRPPAGAEPSISGIDKLALDADLDDVEEGLESTGRRKSLAVGLLAVLIVLGILGAAFYAIRGANGGRSGESGDHSSE